MYTYAHSFIPRYREVASRVTQLCLSYIHRAETCYRAPFCLTAPGRDCAAFFAPKPLTRPYSHLRVAVLKAITTALSTNSPTRPSSGTCSKMGYGYLEDQRTSSTARMNCTPSIILEALLNPKPVAKSDRARQGQRGDNGDRPGWGEEKQISQQNDGRDRVETEIFPTSANCVPGQTLLLPACSGRFAQEGSTKRLSIWGH